MFSIAIFLLTKAQDAEYSEDYPESSSLKNFLGEMNKDDPTYKS